MPVDSPEREPLDLSWSPLAIARLSEIRARIAKDKPIAAERLTTRIVALVETLRTYPYLGRVGAAPRTRELVIGGTPYIVAYEVGRSGINIITVWHGAQQRS